MSNSRYRVGAVAVGLVAVVVVLALMAGVAPALGADDGDSSVTANSDTGSFTIDAVDVPSEAETGQQITVTANIRNTGDGSGERTVTFDVGGSSAETTVSLGAGATETISLDIAAPEDRGDYDWTLDAGDDQSSGTLSVIGPEIVLNDVIAPQWTEPGQYVEFDMDISNVGEREGDVDVSFEFDGEEIGSGTFTYQANENSIVWVGETMPEEPGIYEWTAQVGDQTMSGELEVVGPDFVINDVSGPQNPEPGQTVEFGIDITNEGETYGEKEVSFEFNGEEVGSNVFGFDAGENDIVFADVTLPDEPGTYEWTAYAGDDSYSGETTIEGTDPASFAFDTVNVPSSGDAGETVTVDATVTNTGDQSGETTVSFEFAGERYEQRVSLDGGNTETVRFDVSLPDSDGSYDWTITAGSASESGSLDVTAEEEDAPAEFVVDSVDIPSSVGAGETISVDATITNTGDESGDTTVTIDLGGESSDTTVSLSGGETTTASLTLTVPEDGDTYDWTLTSGDTTETGTLEVTADENDPAEFAFDSVDVPSSGTGGESITVEATVTNTGGESGDTTVTFYLGNNRHNTDVSLDADESQTVTFDVSLPDDGGNYGWSLSAGDASESGDMDVEAEDDPAEFEFDSVDVPSSGDASETVTIEATVSNTGDETDDTTVTFDLAGESYEQTVSLDGDESQTVSLAATLPDEEGDYDWAVTTGDDTETGTLEVAAEEGGGSPEFTIESVDAPAEVNTGDEVTIEATFENEGDNGEETVSLWFAGRNVGEETVELDSDEQTTLTFDLTAPDSSGSKTWTVSGDSETDSGDITVVDEEEQAEFEIDSVDAPQDAKTGDEVSMTVGVTNVGGEEGSETVEIVYDGDVVVSDTLTLESGESDTTTFDLTLPDDPGAQNWRAYVKEDEMSATIEVEESEQADLDITEVDAPSVGETEEDMTVSTDIENDGDEEGSFTLSYSLGGDTLDTETVTLDGGEETTVEFDVTLPDQDGIYDWSMSADDAEETGELEVQETVKTAELSIGDATVDVGETTTVSLDADGEGITSYDVALSFDPDIVSVTEVTDGDIDGVSVTIDEEEGILELSAAQESGVDNPVLADITFETATTSDATTELAFESNPSLFDEDIETFEIDTEPSTLTVEDTAQCQPGDVTGDGELTIADATLIQQYVTGQDVGNDFEVSCADINEDGDITTADVIAAMSTVTELD